MRVAVVGSREVTDADLVGRIVARIFKRWPDAVLVSGGARGVDRIAEQAARRLGHEPEVFHADWDRLGKGAGRARNAEMAEAVEKVVAIWNGVSRGTAHMLDVSLSKRREVIAFLYPRKTWLTDGSEIQAAVDRILRPQPWSPPVLREKLPYDQWRKRQRMIDMAITRKWR